MKLPQIILDEWKKSPNHAFPNSHPPWRPRRTSHNSANRHYCTSQHPFGMLLHRRQPTSRTQSLHAPSAHFTGVSRLHARSALHMPQAYFTGVSRLHARSALHIAARQSN